MQGSKHFCHINNEILEQHTEKWKLDHIFILIYGGHSNKLKSLENFGMLTYLSNMHKQGYSVLLNNSQGDNPLLFSISVENLKRYYCANVSISILKGYPKK